ncbi:hypothetical protein MAXJ12_28033 [Mesorhizobium alhagi CCNWXJ12-2]|uniref:Uncharacterized protein n=1 Tax=Mesorhizobium alhagi CCNWXJ12-2 TaxID=1107882 RepID=H0HZH3_9HYPH|nr:hypothetical protein MAXJ12_28033 [Mesorhizobium alhagi CCNWXJ12-2]
MAVAVSSASGSLFSIIISATKHVAASYTKYLLMNFEPIS